MILDHLVLDDAHAGLGDGVHRELYSRLVRGDRRGAEYRVDLLLGILGEKPLGGLRPLDDGIQGVGARYRLGDSQDLRDLLHRFVFCSQVPSHCVLLVGATAPIIYSIR